MRYADAIIDRLRSRIICVQEEQTGVETVNTLVSINLEGEGHAGAGL